MDSNRKAVSSPTHGDLGRSLRGFLAQGRVGQVNASLWRNIREKLVSNLISEELQLIQSTLAALKKERMCVSQDEWTTLEQLVRQNAVLCGRDKLLCDIIDNVFYPDGPCGGGPQSKKRAISVDSSSVGKRQRSVPPEKASKSEVKMATSLPLCLTTFQLLRSEHIANKKHTLALDEIVTAGADFTVICNYKIDLPWMWDRAPALQTSRKLLIVHGETAAEESEWRAFLNGQGALERVRFARPRTPPYGTVHSKMFLQFFPTGCRVCIHTANMVVCDWDFKTQGAYVRDFPSQEQDSIQLEPVPSSLISVEEDDFKTQLDRYFRYALVGEQREELVRLIAKYNFSSAGVALISSVPGMHKGLSKTHFGHARLRDLLQKESFAASQSKSVAVCQFSSLGSIQQKWLEQEFKDTLFSSAEADGSSPGIIKDTDEIKLVFPTVSQVRGSNEGLQAGASLPVSGKNLHRGHIMSKLHRWDGYDSGYERAMPHIKSFLRYPESRPQSPFWMLLGSFNLSVAAWGRMQGGKGKRMWDRLNVLSYEIGVLFSPSLYCPPVHSIDGSIKYLLLSPAQNVVWKKAKSDNRIALAASHFKAGCAKREEVSHEEAETKVVLDLPIPYKLPPPKYEACDVPWTTEHCATT